MKELEETNKKLNFVIWGGTGQAKVLNELLSYYSHNIVAIVDNNKKINPPFGDIPLLIGKNGLEKWLKDNNVYDLYGIAAIGGAHGIDRLNIIEFFKEKNIKIYTAIHPKAFVARDASIGEGCQILAQSAVCTHVQLGRCCIINTGATVDHNCIIEDGVHIAPGAHVAGETIIGNCSFVATGAIILPKLKIGKNVLIGAGSVVTKNLPDNVRVMGVPAKIVSENYQFIVPKADI